MRLRLNNKSTGIFRFAFFTVWPNGFTHIDDILDLLRKEEHITILSIRRYIFNTMKDFVYRLYSCDSVPVEHLASKLEYLYNLKPEVINIFVQNRNPIEMVTGSPPFRKIQDQYIVEIKNKIRNLYNPRHIDPEFQVPPLDQGVTHEHVIHASDCEEQVDFYLRMLGHDDGISYLVNDNDGLPFEKPFHIQRPHSYSFMRIPISLLTANIHAEKGGKEIIVNMPIMDTPHYKSLCTDFQVYKDYLYKYRFKYMHDDYSVGKFQKMGTLKPDAILRLPPILVSKMGMNYKIIDGVHRASVFLKNGFEKIDSVVFEDL